MDYSIAPFGEIWSGGVFNVPYALADKYIKLASEYQLKALLIILSSNGKNSSAQIAKKHPLHLNRLISGGLFFIILKQGRTVFAPEFFICLMKRRTPLLCFNLFRENR